VLLVAPGNPAACSASAVLLTAATRSQLPVGGAAGPWCLLFQASFALLGSRQSSPGAGAGRAPFGPWECCCWAPGKITGPSGGLYVIIRWGLHNKLKVKKIIYYISNNN